MCCECREAADFKTETNLNYSKDNNLTIISFSQKKKAHVAANILQFLKVSRLLLNLILKIAAELKREIYAQDSAANLTHAHTQNHLSTVSEFPTSQKSTCKSANEI